ncbi:MAG: acetyl-CoA carboxylase biotin carboxyl carrier protein [Clostridiales bacterium]|nr:MAG: acetyl-CoA carboxylase biotin carboxyl carrier protein [Clostridiales bacterium]
MNMQEVNELIQTFSRHGLTCLELEENGKRIVIKKEYGQPGHENARQEGGAQVQPGGQLAEEEMWETAGHPHAQAAPQGAETPQEEGHIIKAPLVGMFYNSPSPEEEPFVRVGETVKKGQVIGIIEAMKLMNEVTSDRDGTVKEIFVENGQVVEYGQPLFSIG